MVRQVMGGVGVAVAATTLSSNSARHRALVSESAGASAAGAQWLERMAAGLAGQGADAAAAQARALRMMDLPIRRQAAVLAYNLAFALVGILFLLCVPLVLFTRHGESPLPTEVHAA